MACCRFNTHFMCGGVGAVLHAAGLATTLCVMVQVFWNAADLERTFCVVVPSVLSAVLETPDCRGVSEYLVSCALKGKSRGFMMNE